jgi:hypothetical protein
MYLPTALFFIFMTLIALKLFITRTSMNRFIEVALIGLVVFDLFRVGSKFTPFTDKSLLYPDTQTVKFLQQNIGHHRLMTTDRRLMPPNVSTFYKLQSVDGYDPLYLLNYGELVAAWTRDQPYITPAAFNRILTPEKVDSMFTDLLGVKYIISLKDETHPKLRLVLQEGETRVYENIQVFPRSFLVDEIKSLASKEEVIEAMFKNKDRLTSVAFTDQNLYVKPAEIEDEEFAVIEEYRVNEIKIRTNANQERLLVLTDIYYPDCKVCIEGKESIIFPVDLALRGVVIPKGEHKIKFVI